MRDSFVFKRQWYEGLRTLPVSEQAEAYTAIVNYALEGTRYEGTNAAIKMLLAIITGQIDSSNDRYSEICRKRKGAAERRWEKQMDANASKSMQMHPNASKSTVCIDLHYDNDSDSDNDSIVSSSTIVESDTDTNNENDEKKGIIRDNTEKNGEQSFLMSPDSYKREKTKFDMVAYLINKGVEQEYIDGWLKVRGKAPRSEVAMKLIDKQVQLAGITWNEAVQECVLRNWTGFKAEWIRNKKQDSNGIYNGQRQDRRREGPISDWANTKPEDMHF